MVRFFVGKNLLVGSDATTKTVPVQARLCDPKQTQTDGC